MGDGVLDDFQAAFWGAKRAMAEANEAAFRRHGVRSGQQFILQVLWADDGLTPGEIARQLELAVPTVTRATTRMEAAGLVRREPDAADARRVRIRLTPRGHELEAIVAREMRGVTERALRTLDPDARAQFTRSLRQLRSNLSQTGPSRTGTVGPPGAGARRPSRTETASLSGAEARR